VSRSTTLAPPDSPPQPLPAAETAIRRVLLVSYHFPPVGGAGVQRPVKFVKYLRRFGWETSVLMASNPSVPVFDNSLCADLPDDLIVERARTWEPGYRFKKNIATGSSGLRTGVKARALGVCRRLLRQGAGMLLQPDPQILWVPAALKAGLRLLRRIPHDAILATAPPYANLLLGGLLKKRTGLPLILDYRDEWDMSSKYLENSQRDWVSHAVQQRMQRGVLRQADAVVATTQASTRRLAERARQAGSRAQTVCIYNGYDTSDFPSGSANRESSTSETRRFRIVYTGTLWNLTNVEPLVQAIERLATRGGDLLNRIELLFVGRKTPEQRVMLDRITQTGCRIEIEDYCDHNRALELMASADALCLLLSDVDGAERVVPAKLFEYLALRREILAITPVGETTDIVRSFFGESHFLPSDVTGIADWLQARANGRPVTGPTASNDERIAQFSRERQAGQLAELLNQVIA